MIPIKLELKNFLSYGDEVEQIDFKDYSLICLSGKNGNGKSAILDSITWAIWGQARKISGTVKPDAGLLRLGQTHMFVNLEFEFSQNIYRVRREFSKISSKSNFSLDFELFDKNLQKFVALTDKTVRQTQLKIESLVGLDYETFVNSAFLRQGAADEFSKKAPKERKQILANILGFTKYDELQNLALDQTKVFIEEKKINEKLQEQMMEQIRKESECSNLLDGQKKVLEKFNLDFVSLENILGGLQKEKDVLAKQKQNYEFVLEDRKKVKQKLDFKLKEFEKNVQTWKQIHYKSLHLPDIKIIEQERNYLIDKEKGFLELQKKGLLIQEQFLHKKDLYHKTERKFRDTKEKELYEKRILIEKNNFEYKQILVSVEQQERLKVQLELKVAGYKKELTPIIKELEKNSVPELDLEKTKAQFEKRKAFYQVLIQKGNWVKAELKELDYKIKKVNEHSSASCPLCEQVLSVNHKSFLGSRFQKDSIFLNYRLDRLVILIKKLKEILLFQNDQIKLLEQKVELEKNLPKDELDYNAVFQSIEKLKKDGDLLFKKIDFEKNDLKQKESTFEVELKNDVQIKELLLDLEKLEKEKNSLSYDKNAHAVLQKKLAEVEKRLKDLELFRQELVEQKDRRNKIHFLIAELKEIKQSILQIDLKLKDLTFDFKVEQALDQKISGFKKQINEKFVERDKILHEFGRAESEFKRILELKEQVEKKKSRLIFLDEQIEEYKILSQALGKDGIQALLIEQAIPQIEEEANSILSRLTDNQSQIFIESLRDLKSGGVKETLDIQISDSAGIRPYEMFSGGEAFRVDFALRIAISKLLAQRAGTALQTLIIDEGFGSQDEEGLGRLMDAIYAIQKDFSKIIIVSHLATFKDNFPVHFMIEKGPSGSFVRIEERG